MIDRDSAAALNEALRLSRTHFPKAVDFFLPGMFRLDRETGLFPAISLTGPHCDLGCLHCRGRLLETMIPAQTPEALVRVAGDAKQRGRIGLLISGGSDPAGRLPWERFFPAIETVVRTTGLIVTVHAGLLDQATAIRLRNAGVAQALVDVIGDDETARTVYRLNQGAGPTWDTLGALCEAGLEAVPHLVAGLYFGKIKGEYQALSRLTDFPIQRFVTVVLSPKARTDLAEVAPPPVEEVARILAEARRLLPRARHHLGCARPRGQYGRTLERLAIQAGVNALALPTEAAFSEARALGLETRLLKTCCSLAGREK